MTATAQPTSTDSGATSTLPAARRCTSTKCGLCTQTAETMSMADRPLKISILARLALSQNSTAVRTRPIRKNITNNISTTQTIWEAHRSFLTTKATSIREIEYTPYGETWVEKTGNTGLEYLPYRFTSKEIDEETGLYYYGARYLDPRYSRWISTDPALGEYIPSAGKDISKLPSGGIYNPFSQSLFNYSNNNPIKYVDPNGKNPVAAAIVISAIQQLKMKKL